MVSIIELDDDDMDRVQGLSVELTEGAESLFDGFYAESPTAHFSSLLGYYGFSC